MTAQLLAAVERAQVLGIFKLVADRWLASPKEMQICRNMILADKDPLRSLQNVLRSRLEIELEAEEAEELLPLILAFFEKRSVRKSISPELRHQLLDCQDWTCAICGVPVNEHSPVDHIVPFKYVGDALSNNHQVLCKSCNSKKNACIDFEIRRIGFPNQKGVRQI